MVTREIIAPVKIIFKCIKYIHKNLSYKHNKTMHKKGIYFMACVWIEKLSLSRPQRQRAM